MATLVGVVRVPLEHLDFSHPQQIDFKVLKRLTRMVKRLRAAGLTEIQIPSAVDQGTVEQILAQLGFSAEQLRGTLRNGQQDTPVLTGIRLCCPYGQHTTATTARNKGTSLVIHLFSVERRSQISTLGYIS